MYICVCLLPGINSVGCVPAGDSVEDDGCTWTSPAPPTVSAAAAAVEQGVSACSCIHTHPWATATAQDPPPGWGQTHTETPLNTEAPVKAFFFLSVYWDFIYFLCGVSLLLDWPKDCGMAHFKPNMAERIVSGNEARPHSWPWQVSLQVNLSLNWRGSVFKGVGGLESRTLNNWMLENVPYKTPVHLVHFSGPNSYPF